MTDEPRQSNEPDDAAAMKMLTSLMAQVDVWRWALDVWLAMRAGVRAGTVEPESLAAFEKDLRRHLGDGRRTSIWSLYDERVGRKHRPLVEWLKYRGSAGLPTLSGIPDHLLPLIQGADVPLFYGHFVALAASSEKGSNEAYEGELYERLFAAAGDCYEEARASVKLGTKNEAITSALKESEPFRRALEVLDELQTGHVALSVPPNAGALFLETTVRIARDPRGQMTRGRGDAERLIAEAALGEAVSLSTMRRRIDLVKREPTKPAAK